MRRLRSISWIVIIGALLVAGCAKHGKPVPDFSITLMDGEDKEFSSYEGTPVVLDFFGTDCVPCMAELPRFQEAYSKYSGRFELVVLSDKLEGVQQFVAEHGYTMTFAVDHGGKGALAVAAIPHTFFINRQGQIVSDFAGEMSAADFDKQLQAIL